MIKKNLFIITISIMVVFVLAGCGYELNEGEEENEDLEVDDAVSVAVSDFSLKDEESRLLLGTSSQGGTYYVWGGGWAKIMGDSIPGLDISVEVTGGPVTNVQLIDQGEMDIGFVTTWLGGEAYEGIGWADKKYDNFGSLFPMYPSILYLYSLQDIPIETIQDINGKHISVGPPGSTSDIAGRAVLDNLGIETREISALPTNTQVDNLKDGLVDANFAVAGAPGPFMLDLEATHDVRHIELSDEEIDKMLEDYPYWTTYEVPSDMYKDLDEDITQIAFWNVAIASLELSEELVYELVKQTFENHQQLLNVDPTSKDTLAENVIHNGMPLHPGAYKYYKEIGIEIPDELVPPEKND
ncbi:TAXI family TRAP transporter solute-binding subunit [Oceanobacillus sp. AG]|uniref:TAXI family TRAP transporter solute-binding subunit n=1 Tax=Oceanobacillus sp. AG TaxID=2681969 RepID=UPI0012EB3FE5|nr:TAXI family TRAP transporter solute-binding subunit [Oceanobacillus sp. AG]